MVTSEAEIARRLAESDAARSARRAHAATTVGKLAGRHAELASQVSALERELGEVLLAAADVIELAELAEVTDLPVDDLTRWRDQASKPARGRRKRPTPKKNHTATTAGAEPRTAHPAAVMSAGVVDTASD